MTLNVLIILVIACWVLVGLCFAAWGVTMAIVALARFIARPWRHAQAVIEDGEPPEWWEDTIGALIPIVMCPICRDDTQPGNCSCWAACGHPACDFAHVELTNLDEAEERFVNGKGAMPWTSGT